MISKGWLSDMAPLIVGFGAMQRQAEQKLGMCFAENALLETRGQEMPEKIRDKHFISHIA